MNNFDIFLLLVWIGLPILFYFFAFKNHDEKKADLIVFIVCTYIVINYLASIASGRFAISNPTLLITFPIFQILTLVFLGLKFYSIDIFNKFNGKLVLIIFVILQIISQLIFFVSTLYMIGIYTEYFGIIRSLLRIISGISFVSILVLYLIMINERKFTLFSKASDTVKNNLSVGEEKSKYSKDHPSNW